MWVYDTGSRELILDIGGYLLVYMQFVFRVSEL